MVASIHQFPGQLYYRTTICMGVKPDANRMFAWSSDMAVVPSFGPISLIRHLRFCLVFASRSQRFAFSVHIMAFGSAFPFSSGLGLYIVRWRRVSWRASLLVHSRQPTSQSLWLLLEYL